MIKVSFTVVSRKKKIKLEKKHGEIYSQALLCMSEKENVAMSHQTTSLAILSQPKTNSMKTVSKYTSTNVKISL